MSNNALTQSTVDLQLLTYDKTEFDVARFFRRSVQTVRRDRQQGRGPQYKKIGGLVRYSLQDILAWVDAQPGGGQKIAV